MTHVEYQQRISQFIDIALTDKESSELYTHLAECDECRMFMRISMSVRSRIADETLEEVPQSLDRRVLLSGPQRKSRPVRESRISPVWFTRISIPLPAAASLLFLVIVGSLLLSPLIIQEKPQGPDTPSRMLSRIPTSLQRPF